MIRSVLLAAVVASASLTSPAFGQGSGPVVDLRSPAAAEAANVIDVFHAALARADVAAALAVLADDVLIFEAGHVERSKSEYASHHAPADAAYASAVPSKLQKRTAVADADVAWVTSESRATGRYKDKAVDQLATETMMLRKTVDGWRIIHIHWSSRPAPK